MTLEEIKALLKESQEGLLGQVKESLIESLSTFKTEILTEVDKKNSGTVSSLLKTLKPKEEKASEEKAPEEKALEEKEGKLSLKALEKQLIEFKAQLEDKDKKLSQKELETQLLAQLNAKKVINPSLALKAFKMETEGSLQQEDGVWYVKKGDSADSLDKALEAFLDTEFGKTLLPPVSKARGSGLKPQNTTVAPKEGEKKDILDELFLEEG